MKRRKTLIILLCTLAIVCISAIVLKQVEEHKENIKNTDEVILSVDSETVKSLSWKYDSTSLAFHKEDGNWKWDGDEEFPVDNDKIDNLLSRFESFGAAFIIEDVDDFSQYGLDNPACTIEFSTDEQNYTILLGNFSALDSQRYVSIGDGNVYLLKSDPLATFGIEVEDTILNDEVPVFDQINSIEFSKPENYTVTYDEDSTESYCSSDVYYAKISGKTVPLSTDNVESYCSNISSLSLSEYASYNVTEAELSEWGLDKPELTVTVNYTSDDEPGTFTLNIGRNQEELAAKNEVEEEGEEYSGNVTAYARIGDSQIVYTISESDYNKLVAAGYNDLRHSEVFTADIETVAGIDISLEGFDYSVTSERDEKEDARTYFYNEEELEITNLRSRITALSITEFTNENPSGKEELSMVIRLDNEKYPQVTMKFYRYDGSSCLVVLNGQTLGLVERSQVVDLIEAVNQIVLG